MNTIIEITDNFVKFTQARMQGGRPQVVRCIERRLKENSDAELSRVLLETVRGKSVEPERLVFAVSRRFVIIKYMKLPSLKDAELHKMVGLQLVNQIPFSLEEVIYDYHLIKKDSDGYSHVQAIVVNKAITSRYLKVLNEAGIKSARMTLSSLGILGWGENYLKQVKDSSSFPVLFVNLDYKHIEIIFMQGKKLLFSRSINYGECDLNAEGIQEISRQLQMSISAYKQDQMGADIKKVVLISKVSEVESLKEAVQQLLGLIVVTTQPFQYITYKKSILANNNFISSMSVPLGLLFTPVKEMINLTPVEVYVGKHQTMMRKNWAAFFILLIMVFGLAVSVFWVDVNFKEKQLAELIAQRKTFGPQLKHIKQRSLFINEFNKELAKRVYIPQLIDLIYSQTPPDISFRSIILDGNNKLTLQGYAQTSKGINTFQERLVRSPEFHSVNLQFATKRRIFNIEVTDFKIVADLGIKLE